MYEIDILILPLPQFNFEKDGAWQQCLMMLQTQKPDVKLKTNFKIPTGCITDLDQLDKMKWWLKVTQK